MKKAYDVIIIGGGIIGCATAFELAKRGITDILLIEKRFLTSGATGRCGAGIRQQWGSELNARIALESTHIFEHLEEYTGYTRSCGLHQGGYLLVAYTEKEWAQFQENLKVQHKLGIDSRAVDLKEAKEIVPYLNTDGMFGATFCQKDGHADPFQCTQAYAQGAKRKPDASTLLRQQTEPLKPEPSSTVPTSMRQSWLKWLVRTFLLLRNAIRRW